MGNAIKSEAVTIESDSYSELYLAVSNMRIDRYFSGFKTSSIMNDAKELLQHQDYIGFFQSCGTNYVRSIRRAQEITAIFKFSSPSRDLAQEFAAEIKTQGGAPAIDESIFDQEKFSTVKQNLEVKILAYGLGLNAKGESVIVSTSVKNYNKVMEFAFRSFTQSTDSSNVGMVYALEFVPWVDNPSFQHASKIFDEDIELPLSRSLIPRAIADDGVLSFVNNRLIRSQFSCKHLYFSIDKFGYCCDAAELFHQERGLYETEELDIESSSRICKPNRKLEKSVIKNTMSNNGEFVARLELTVQKKINQLFTLEKCVASVNSMVEKYDSYILKSQGSTKYDSSVEGKFTVNQLKMSLDPIGDLSLITHMGNELDEFINMYYQPCIAALFGTNVGSSPDVEAKYFMAYGWLTHEACSKLSCLADNMRWNRNGSGCIGSLITGRKAPIYDDNDIACKKDDEVNPSDGSELCKYDTTDLQLYQTRLNDCWDRDDPNPTSRVPYYMLEHFCMPEITGEKINEDIIHPCQFPCHGISLVLSDDNMETILSDNASNEAIVKCFDTTEVTNMDQFLMGSNTATSPYPEVRYLGCFIDTDDRALPMFTGTGKTTSECIELCKGYKFVARQYYGQCWCGDDDNYDRHGAADDCICEGETVGDFRMCVFEYKTSVKEPSQASPSITPELSSVVPTLFPTKTNSSAYVPTPSPTAVYRCEKDNGKKFEYLSEKYSCKQLKKTKKKYRKRICMRVKRARNLCPVICKSKN